MGFYLNKLITLKKNMVRVKKKMKKVIHTRKTSRKKAKDEVTS